MGVAIVPHHAKTSEAEVQAFEQRIGAALPQDYRDFLLSHNGGHPDLSQGRHISFPIRWREGQPWAEQIRTSLLDTLDPLDPAHDRSLHVAYHNAREVTTWIPEDTIAIGSASGCSILIGIKGENRGRIFAWLHEFSQPEGSPPTYYNVGFVAESFTEFLRSLRAEN